MIPLREPRFAKKLRTFEFSERMFNGLDATGVLLLFVGGHL